MFALFGGDACGGNREKVDIKNAIPLTPPAPSNAVADGAAASISPGGPPVPSAEELQAAAGKALESTVQFTNEASDSMTRQVPVGSLSEISQHALEDVSSAVQAVAEVATSTLGGAQEQPDARSVVANDGAIKKHVLRSFQDRDSAEAEVALDTVSSSDSDAREDAENLKEAAKMLREQKRAMAGKKPALGTSGDDNHQTMLKALQGDMEDLKMIYDPNAAALGRGKSGGDLGMKSTGTNATNRTLGSRTVSNSGLTSGGSGDDLSGVLRPSQNSAEPAAAENEEEEDDENVGGDDEETINRKYEGRDRHGMEAKAEEIRQKLKLQGLEEPPDMSRQLAAIKNKKAKTLEVVFLDRDDNMAEKRITFRRRAHGITWDKRSPLEVLKVKGGSHGAELGVEEHWQVRDIDGIKCDHKKCSEVIERFNKAVSFLPEQIAQEDEDAALAMEGQSMVMRVRITVESARGFQNDLADHFCVCLIPGKPHSQVQTESKCVQDTPDTPELTWGETFELFDFQSGDKIEMAVYAQERAASVAGEDTSLGRVRLTWEQFSHKGFHGELALISSITNQPTKTKMKVKIERDMVPEREQAITDYRRIMRKKMLALGVPKKDVDASFPDVVNPGSFTTASDAVRDALKSYHKYSESLGVFMPFPHTSEQGEEFTELEPAHARKLVEYGKRLDNTDPNRLWTTDEGETGAGANLGETSRAANAGTTKASSQKQAPSSMRSKMLGKLFRSRSAVDKSQELVGQAKPTVPNIEIMFLDESKNSEPLTFEHTPLGIVWSTKMPLRIVSFEANSYAEEEGAKTGWKVQSVAGQDVTKKWYKGAKQILDKHLDSLAKKQ